MKPTTTKKAGEVAFYGGSTKRQYYPGKKSFMKRRAAKAARREAKEPISPKTFRVYVSQVNQTYVEVKAANPTEASEKGYLKWRREFAHSHVSAIEEIASP